MEVGDLLIAAHIEGADDDRGALEGRGDLTVSLELLLLGGKLGGVHEEELGAEQTDGLGVVLESVGDVLGAADVAGEDLLDAVGGDGLLATEGLESGLLLGKGLSLGLVIGHDGVLRLGDDDALGAVDDDGHAIAQRRAAVCHGQDGRDLQRAGDDSGVGGAATGLGNDAGDMLLVDGRGHGRSQVMHDDDGVLGQDGEIDDLDTQQLGKDAGADVGNVGGAEAEHLIVHREEHVLEHGGSVHQGLLGASAAIDGAADRVRHARILGEDDVTGHDLGLVLTHGDLHVVGLGLGLLAEDGQSSLIALLLGGGVGHLAGLEGQVGIDGHHDGTDADALRSVNSLVHYVSSLLFPIRAHGEQKHRRPRIARTPANLHL